MAPFQLLHVMACAKCGKTNMDSLGCEVSCFIVEGGSWTFAIVERDKLELFMDRCNFGIVESIH